MDAGSYTVAEGTELTLAPIVNDPDAGDVLTYKWTVNATGIDAGGDCTFDDDTKKNAKITCTDDSQGGPAGKFTLTLEVNDGTAPTVSDNADLTVTNANPVANAGGPYSGNEGSAIQLSGSGDDPGNNDDPQLGYQWTVVTTGIDAGGTCTFDNAASKNAKVTCTDDGSFKVSLVVSDDDGGTSVASEATLTVANLAPTANAGGPYSGDEGSAIQLAGSADDPGDNDDPHLTYQWTAVTTGIDPGGDLHVRRRQRQERQGHLHRRRRVQGAPGGHRRRRRCERRQRGEPDGGERRPGRQRRRTVQRRRGLAGPAQRHRDRRRAPTTPISGCGNTWPAPGSIGGTCSFGNDTRRIPTITCTDDGTVELTLKVTDDDGGRVGGHRDPHARERRSGGQRRRPATPATRARRYSSTARSPTPAPTIPTPGLAVRGGHRRRPRRDLHLQQSRGRGSDHHLHRRRRGPADPDCHGRRRRVRTPTRRRSRWRTWTGRQRGRARTRRHRGRRDPAHRDRDRRRQQRHAHLPVDRRRAGSTPAAPAPSTNAAA